MSDIQQLKNVYQSLYQAIVIFLKLSQAIKL